MTKLEKMIESLNNWVEWHTEDAEKEAEKFKKWASEASAYQIAEFGASYARNVKKALEKVEKVK